MLTHPRPLLDDTFLTDAHAFVHVMRGVVFQGYVCRFQSEAYRDALFDEFGVATPVIIMAAVEKRRSEFLAGRFCARQALAALGVDAETVPIGVDRAPQWPLGVRASISHTAGSAICIATSDPAVAGVGVDVESMLSPATAADVRDSVVNADEQALIEASFTDVDLGLTLVFSAKESIYKALYPQVGRFFGFEAVRLVRCLSGELKLVITHTLSPSVRGGLIIRAGYQVEQASVQTLVCVLHSELT